MFACLAASAVLCGGAATTAVASGASHTYSHSIGGAGSTPPNPYPVSQPTDVAVDQANGDVYIADTANHRIEKFDSAGNFLLMFGKDVNATTGGNVCTAASGDV